MKLLLSLAAASLVVCAGAPALAQSPEVSAAQQAAFDKKFGVAPKGTWWDAQGRLCRTNMIDGKPVRNCDKPATPSNANQARLAAKFGPAPENQWWDESGRLCRRNDDGSRRCEAPGTIR